MLIPTYVYFNFNMRSKEAQRVYKNIRSYKQVKKFWLTEHKNISDQTKYEVE